MDAEVDHSRPCRHCGVDLDGGVIPEDIRHHYAPPFRWGREILVKTYHEDNRKT